MAGTPHCGPLARAPTSVHSHITQEGTDSTRGYAHSTPRACGTQHTSSARACVPPAPHPHAACAAVQRAERTCCLRSTAFTSHEHPPDLDTSNARDLTLSSKPFHQCPPFSHSSQASACASRSHRRHSAAALPKQWRVSSIALWGSWHSSLAWTQHMYAHTAPTYPTLLLRTCVP